MADLWSRRRFLVASGAGAAVVLAGCGGSGSRPGAEPPGAGGLTPTMLDAIAAREAQRASVGGRVRSLDLVAGPLALDLAGTVVETVGFGQRVPGTELRATAGDTLQTRLRSELSTPTTIHWHGLAIRNDMDGVPGMTQNQVEPGGEFVYSFVVPDPGTYWFHPHMGLDLDRGMYAPLIVDDPSEPGAYDADAVVVLDDWLDRIDERTPEQVFASLASGSMGGMDHGSMGMGTEQDMGSMSDRGDVDYPMHLINGRPSADAETVRVGPGGRVRLRFVNAGSDTIYQLALGGHAMTVTHLDGFPIVPAEVDTVSLSMGERVDVLVDLESGVWPLLALPDGKDGSALLWLRTSDSTAEAPVVPSRLPEHGGRLLDVFAVQADESVALATTAGPDREVQLSLTGGMMSYDWGIDGRRFGDHEPITIGAGERLRLRFRNGTMMVHPMHVHGHTFALRGARGARKDTVLVEPMSSVEVDLLADNPGRWMIHCHNTYHLEAGMATELIYDL